MRFLIASQPVIGHVEPGLVIADALRERGHEVCWYTGSCVRPRIESKGYRVFGIRRAFDYDGADPNRYFPQREGLTGLADLKFIIKHVLSAAMAPQADLSEILKSFPADVMVADFVTYGPRVVAERGGPPWAAYGFSALALSSLDTAPYGFCLAPSTSRLGRIRNRSLNWVMKDVVMRDEVRHYDSMRGQLGLDPVDLTPTDVVLSPYLYLQGTVPEFEYPRSDLPRQVHFVGALTPAPREGSWEPPSWWPELLQEGRPVVLVTQGTMDNKDLAELMQPALSGLAGEDVLVVATTGRALTPGELVVPRNARVESFVPYHELLPHVDVMVSNAGYNGVVIALSNGVPLVVHGAQADKPEICARVRWSGAGVRLPGKRARPEAVRAAVRRVLSSSSTRERARSLARCFGARHAGRTSAELLERLALTRAPIWR